MTLEPNRPESQPTYSAIVTTLTWVVLVDAGVIGLVSWLYVRKALAIYPLLLIVALMFIGTFAVVWRMAPRRGPVAGARVSKLMWFCVAAYTVMAVGSLASWAVQPSIRSGAQTLMALALASFLWWVVRVLRKMQRDNSKKDEHSDLQ